MKKRKNYGIEYKVAHFGLNFPTCSRDGNSLLDKKDSETYLCLSYENSLNSGHPKKDILLHTEDRTHIFYQLENTEGLALVDEC